jgi:hypothetical protein
MAPRASRAKRRNRDARKWPSTHCPTASRHAAAACTLTGLVQGVHRRLADQHAASAASVSVCCLRLCTTCRNGHRHQARELGRGYMWKSRLCLPLYDLLPGILHLTELVIVEPLLAVAVAVTVCAARAAAAVRALL